MPSAPEGSMPLDGAAATAAERARFLAARGGDEALAEEMLTAHLEWRARTLPLPAGSKTIGGGLPVFCKGLASKCKEGNRVLLVLGAMYDANAGTNEEYALALAALFDTQLDRNSDEKVTVLVDCRYTCTHTPLPTARNLWPFLRTHSWMHTGAEQP